MKRVGKKISTIVGSAFLIGIISGFFLFANVYSANSLVGNNEGVGNDKAFNKIRTVYDIMVNEWYFGENSEAMRQRLIDSAIAGMLTLEEDPHTSYFTTLEASEFASSLEGRITGIGVTFNVIEGFPIIARVLRETPAEEAGLLSGDMIFAADGVSLEGKNSDEVADIIRGTAGSEVKLTIHRGDVVLNVTVVRREITTTAFYEINEDELGEYGYLEISQFASTTSAQVEDILEKFTVREIDRIIIDLRGNPGGYLTSVQAIAGLFMPKDSLVLQTRNRNGVIEAISTKREEQYEFENIIVLVDGSTASAAEVLAAAFQDHLGVLVVGNQTFGKGTVQTQRTLYDFSIIKYTVDEWLTSSNKTINDSGLMPDIVVDMDDVFRLRLTRIDDRVFSFDEVAYQIAEMQLLLEAFGYNPGRADGYFSEGTRAALIRFQIDNGLEGSGVYDKQTYDKIIANYVAYVNNPKNDRQLSHALLLLLGGE